MVMTDIGERTILLKPANTIISVARYFSRIDKPVIVEVKDLNFRRFPPYAYIPSPQFYSLSGRLLYYHCRLYDIVIK